MYLRVAEAQRCHVNCCIFLPVFASPARDRVAAVLEVVQTEDNARFAGLVDWAKVCLEGAGLWTIDSNSDTLPVGLRSISTEYEASAFESKVEARVGQIRTATASMPPPPAPMPTIRQGAPAPSNTHSFGSAQPVEESTGPIVPVTGWQNGPPSQTIGPAAAAAEMYGNGNGSCPTNISQDLLPKGHVRAPNSNARVVQVGNNLVLSCDVPEDSGWHLQIGSGNGSGGSSEQIAQQQQLLPPIPAGMPMPQGFPTSYGHGDRTITIEDLAPHFHVSLRDAASRMGISVTTLKRACRRLGLQRWPRRELASRAQEVSAAAAQVAAAVAANTAQTQAHVQALAGDALRSWASGQTISADSSGDHLLDAAQAAAVAAAAAGQMPFNSQQFLRPPMPGCGPLPLFNDGSAFLNGVSNGYMNTQTHSLKSLDI